MRQLTMINQVKELSSLDSNVRAVFMYGSFSKGEGDKHSDIEFYFFLTDANSIDEKNWAAQIGEVILFFKNEFGTKVAIYDDLIRAEFHFLDVKDITIIKQWEGLISFENKEKMIHVDKDGLLKEILDSISIISPIRNSRESIVWLSQSLVNSLVYTGHLIARNEWAHAHMSFSYIQKYTLWLMRVEASAFTHWESPSKSAEKDIPKALYQKYEKICPSLNQRELIESFRSSVEIANELFFGLRVSQNIISTLERIRKVHI
ncbi:aminoglycoside 6-adenylyltransferase [Peredibacter sp. HCB2-198]|uniref:aminoglycoside 6-adenylyltransferase n=1 Tax=Peredibacter sp. HCB2-198 TaxID=3383025 RepID=UPI0038B61146